MYYPDIHVTSTSIAEGSTSTTPIIVFLHGHEDPRLPNHRIFYTPYANTLRELGYIVAVLDYRPNNGAYQDIKEAIRWVYRHVCASSYETEMIYVMVCSILKQGSGMTCGYVKITYRYLCRDMEQEPSLLFK